MSFVRLDHIRQPRFGESWCIIMLKWPLVVIIILIIVIGTIYLTPPPPAKIQLNVGTSLTNITRSSVALAKFHTLDNGYISPDPWNLKSATENTSITVFEDGKINVNSHYTNLTTKSNSIVGYPCVHHRDVQLVVILLLRSKRCKVRPARERIVFN